MTIEPFDEVLPVGTLSGLQPGLEGSHLPEALQQRVAAVADLVRTAPAGVPGEPRLVWRAQREAIGQWVPGEDPGVVGAADTAAVRLGGEGVAAQHCAVWVMGGMVWVRDLGTEEGTRVNGRRIVGPVALMEGDVLEVGREFVVVLDS